MACIHFPMGLAWLVGLLSLMAAAAVSAAPADGEAVGTWSLSYRVGQRERTARLTISRAGDGSLTGTWAGPRGRETVYELAAEAGKLGFVRQIRLGQRDVRLEFRGKIDGDKLGGVFTGLRQEITVAGARGSAGAPSPGGRGQGGGATRPEPTHRDVAYGDHRQQVIDVWLAESGAPTPLVLYIHGGGFRAGSKRSLDARALDTLLGAGISVAAVEYRFVHHKKLPAAHHDCRRALQFLRSRAREWNIDKARVGAFGGSAGAQICMWLAFHDDMADPDSDDPIARESTRLTCVATNGGQTTMDFAWWQKHIPGYDKPHRDPFESFDAKDEQELSALVKEVSALSLVSADDPAIYMQYGQKPDDPVPDDPQRARGWKIHHVMFGIRLKERMDELGVEANLQYPGKRTTYGTRERFFIEKLTRGGQP